MNGSLYNDDHGLYFRCFNTYVITFKDGSKRYARAKCKSDAEDMVRYFDDEDRYDDIVSVEELSD